MTAAELKLLKAAMTDEGLENEQIESIIIKVNGVSAVKFAKKDNKILKLVSGDENIVIRASDGKAVLANAKEVFTSGISHYFKAWNLDNISSATPETAVEVYELISNAKFSEIFKSFDVKLDNLCLTQNQIRDFCADRVQWLSRYNQHATLFLIRKDEKKTATSDNLFVAYTGIRSDGLYGGVSGFEINSSWIATCSDRVVVPKLID